MWKERQERKKQERKDRDVKKTVRNNELWMWNYQEWKEGRLSALKHLSKA